MNYIYRIVLGDASGDGHCMTRTYHIVTDCPREDMNVLNKSIMDMDIDKLSEEYECRHIHPHFLDLIISFGVYDTALESIEEDSTSPSGYSYLGIDDYFDIYLLLLRTICNKYTFYELNNDDSFYIGAYGVFGS